MSGRRKASGEDAQGQARPCGCDEAIARLYEYMDAELPESDCARLAAHLAVCPTCHDAVSAEEHLRAVLRRSCVEAAPERLRLRVVTQITRLRVSFPPVG